MTCLLPQRPLLRYHGGKWMIAKWIIGHFPKHSIYVEPFGGGGSVLLRKARCYAEVYNEMDGEIVNLFRVARDCGDKLVRALELTPFARDEFNESYNPTDDPLEQARRTVMRSRMGFGGNFTRPTTTGKTMRTGFRSYSKKNRRSTPCNDWRTYPESLKAIIERLQGVIIENRDAMEVMAIHDGPDTLHYVDPPYVLSTRNSGADYRYELTDEDHRRLAAGVHDLRGAVVISGYDSELYNRLFSDWKRVERKAMADGARERTEVLWINRIEGHRTNHPELQLIP